MKKVLKTKKDTNRKWFVIDADGKVLGRLAVQIARVLSGKNKESFTPHIDNGDCVVVINASKIRFTGNKLSEKVYTRYSGYPSGLKKFTLGELFKKKPQEVIRRAVKGMLPKNKLGSRMITRLKVYPNAEHTQKAQQPHELKIK